MIGQARRLDKRLVTDCAFKTTITRVDSHMRPEDEFFRKTFSTQVTNKRLEAGHRRSMLRESVIFQQALIRKYPTTLIAFKTH